jgi:transcription elongation factor GreB
MIARGARGIHLEIGLAALTTALSRKGERAVRLSEFPRYITPSGFRRLRTEYDSLFGVERPKMVETVSWAASLGDRSENADYIYGKRRLREIDRRLAHLARVMKQAKVVDPSIQPTRDQVRFGATVELADEDDIRRVITIVGDDETDAAAGLIGWSAPMARALVGAKVGEERTVRLPAGEKSYEVIAIRYPD